MRKGFTKEAEMAVLKKLLLITKADEGIYVPPSKFHIPKDFDTYGKISPKDIPILLEKYVSMGIVNKVKIWGINDDVGYLINPNHIDRLEKILSIEECKEKIIAYSNFLDKKISEEREEENRIKGASQRESAYLEAKRIFNHVFKEFIENK